MIFFTRPISPDSLLTAVAILIAFLALLTALRSTRLQHKNETRDREMKVAECLHRAKDALGGRNGTYMIALTSTNISLERRELAERDVKLALKADGESSEARRYLAILNLVDSRVKSTDRPAKALPDARAAVVFDLSNAKAHNLLAVIYAKLGDDVSAEHHYGEAIRLDPSDAITSYNYGRFLLARGKADQALAHLEAVLERDAAFPAAWAAKGHALLCTGRAKEAILALTKAVELYEESP